MDSPLRDMKITCTHQNYQPTNLGDECVTCGLLQSTVEGLNPVSLQKESWKNRQEDIDAERKAQGITSLQKESEWEEKIRVAARLRPSTEESAMEYADEAIKEVKKAIANREKEIAEEVENYQEYGFCCGSCKTRILGKVLSIIKH